MVSLLQDESVRILYQNRVDEKLDPKENYNAEELYHHIKKIVMMRTKTY